MNILSSIDLIILSPIIWVTIMTCITCIISGYSTTSILNYSSLTGLSTKNSSVLVGSNEPIIISKILIHLTFLIGILLLGWSYNEVSGPVIYGNGLFQSNSYIIMIQTLVWITAYVVMMIYSEELSKKSNDWLLLKSYDFLTIIYTNIIGLFIVIGSNDIISLYIGIELQTLGAFILVALRKMSEYSIEGALKYFVLGALSSALLLLGIGLVYVSLGTTNYSNINTLLTNLIHDRTQGSTIYTLQIAYILIMVSLLFKLGAAPFHNWIPDVYQGSTSLVTLYFVTVPKLGLITALIIIINNAVSWINEFWILTLICCSVLSMVVGTAGALNQYNLKRLLAFSAISHTGYLLIGVLTNNLDSVVNITVYLILYILMSLVTWGIVINSGSDTESLASYARQEIQTSILSHDTLESSVVIDNSEYHKVSQFDIKGLGRTQPVLAFVLAITLLSIAGIPPLAGFYTKWLIFSSAVENGFVIIATIGIVTSVIGAVYYLKVIHYMYFRLPENAYNELPDLINGFIPMKLITSFIISISLLVIMLFLFIPNVCIDLVTISVLSLR